ncbi:hypothetical protein BDR26DRAFT_1004058, partial [Obelidium mucronatum]
MKQYIIKSVATKHLMYNTCVNVLDRVKALAIVDSIEDRNKLHVAYNHGIYETTTRSRNRSSSSSRSTRVAVSPPKRRHSKSHANQSNRFGTMNRKW